MEFLTRYPTARHAAHLSAKRLATFCAKHGYSGRRTGNSSSPGCVPPRPAPSTRPLCEAVRDVVTALVTVLKALSTAVKDPGRSVVAHLGGHPDNEIFTCCQGRCGQTAGPGLGPHGTPQVRRPWAGPHRGVALTGARSSGGPAGSGWSAADAVPSCRTFGDGKRMGARMNEMSDAWSRLMSLPACRVAIVCARIAAIGFLVSWVGLVVGGVAGMPGHTFVVLWLVAVALAVVGGVIAWIVVLLATRFLSQQSVAAGGPRFAVIWLRALMVLYLRELLSPRRSPTTSR